MMLVTSAAGVLSLLDEKDMLKSYALKKLDTIVDMFWAEIAEKISKIEILYEDDNFKMEDRQQAALIASKVYYHLSSFEESLTFALGADKLFDMNENSEYVRTIINKCVDHYIKLRIHNDECEPGDQKSIDPRLENIVNRMFQRCFEEKQFKQAIGIALETRRIDIFEQAILSSEDVASMLAYSLRVCMALIQNRKLRNTVLRVLVRIYVGLENPDFINVCQTLIFLDDPQAVSDILQQLVKSQDEDQILIAFQIGFDLYESATQQFLLKVASCLQPSAPTLEKDTGAEVDSDVTSAEKSNDGSRAEDDVEMKDSEKEKAKLPVREKKFDNYVDEQLDRLATILGGQTTIDLHLQFLIRNNKTDLLILKNTKDAVRNSVCHNATVIANGFMHCGTTSDQFLRDNLDWLSRATNWAKFTATASLGVIHRGHEKEALNLMSTYLPKDSSPGSAYQEGGGLYALGLIHANHGGEITDYILNQLKESTTDSIRHGACLGLGLAAMGTVRYDIYSQLKFNLDQDDAVTGEAAGIAIGLVMLGSKTPKILEDMVSYAKETQHEKILRGLAIGIALTMYGRLEEADALIDSLACDKDPILRWSGMYTIAMAYCGAGNNSAIRRLLHVAVSDVNDDVRRTAVTSLGFLLFRTPEQCPPVVSLLSESYNPHVRYGAAMALGIACAGTGLKEALALLDPMTNDPVNYVRQGALIASAMILIQKNEQSCPKVIAFRSLYAKLITDKHEDVMAKFGAIIAQGILDAGGRNVTISLQSRNGHTNMVGVVGALIFCQYWYWYPLAHFLMLSFTPTSVIGLNSQLQMPNIQFKSNAKPSTFSYHPPLEEKKDKNKEKIETAILSTTARHKKKEAEKKKESSMEVDEDKKLDEKVEDNKMEDDRKEKLDEDKKKKKEVEVDDKKEKKEDEKKKKKEQEPSFEMLNNPARVMHAQLKVTSLPADCRYRAIKDVSIGGIIMLRDSKPGDDQDIVELMAAGGPKMEDEEDEPGPPEPFEYVE